MPYFVYLIGSFKNSKIKTYVGYTNNLKKRLLLHNSSRGARFTRGRHWKLIYYIRFNNKSDALKYEYQLNILL